MLDLKAQIELRGGGDLSPVVAEGLPTEIGPIAGAVNQLMERLRRVLEAERSFTTNSAHELRTPIAAALAQTQRLIAEAPDGPLGTRARQIETSLRRLTRLSEKLMQLARVEGGGLVSETPQNLALVLPHVIDEFRQNHETGTRLNVTAPMSSQLWSRMDPDAFAILMRNLIENALKHGPAGSPVAITLTVEGAISVAKGGPVVVPDVLARLTGRFERG
jgi:two-component system OmpR family sensor kinase